MFVMPMSETDARPAIPWVSVGIVVACTVIQAISSITAPAEAEQRAVEELRGEAYEEVVAAHGPPGLSLRPVAAQWEFVRAYRSGAIADDDAERVARFHAAEAAHEAMRRKHLALWMANTAQAGLSFRTFTAAFAHDGWLHLFFNMLFLWVIGTHLEVLWGTRLFAALYGLGIVASDFVFARFNPGSEALFLGASGAVAATMAAFAFCYWSANCRYWYSLPSFKTGLRTGSFHFYPTFLLPMWIAEQATMSQFESMGGDGVAYSAHLGGILLGAGFATIVKWRGHAPMPTSYAPKENAAAQSVNDDFVNRADTLLLTGNPHRAVEMLQEVLARDPFHPGARSKLFSAALALKDAALAGELGTEQLRLGAVDHDDALVLQTYRDLHEQVPAAQLSEAALAIAFRAAVRAKDEALLLSAGRRLVKEHEHCNVIPEVLVQISAVHDRAGRAEQARNAMAHLLEKHPDHPLAAKARIRLTRA